MIYVDIKRVENFFANCIIMAKKRKRIVYSEDFKREKVSQLEAGEVTVAELVRMYGMHRSAIYVWKGKFGSLPKGEKLVVEKESE